MIFSSGEKFDLERLFVTLQKGFWIAAPCCISLFFVVYLLPIEEMDLSSVDGKGSVPHPLLSMDGLIKGPLALSPAILSPLVPDLSSELIILAKSSKPMMHAAKHAVLVSTRGSVEPKVIFSGEQVFMQKMQQPDGQVCYHFCEEKAPLWIRPFVSASEEVSVEIGMFTSSKEDESFIEEVSEVIIPQVSSLARQSRHGGAYMTCAASSLFWGADLFFKNYGGREYRDLAGKAMLEMPSETGVDVFYVSAGDFLQWRDGAWRQCASEMVAEELPLAEVKEVGAKELELHLWDEKGFFLQSYRLPLQAGSCLAKAELTGATVKQKTSAQLVCMIGKRRFHLKEGDWLIRVGRAWRLLSRARDIDDFLAHRMRGELFVFESLERQGGKVVMKGSLFDEMRTQMLPVSVPVNTELATKEKEKKMKASRRITKTKKGDL